MVQKKLIQRHFKVNQIGWKISRKGLFYIALNFPTKDGQRKAFGVYLLSINTPFEIVTKDLGVSNRTLHSWVTSFNEKGPVFFAESSLDMTLDRVDERSGLDSDSEPESEDISTEEMIAQSKDKVKNLKGELKEVKNKPILDDSEIESILDTGINDFIKHNGKLRLTTPASPSKAMKRDILKDYTLPSKPVDVNAEALRILNQAHKEGKKDTPY